jgi:hypothetical protein
MDIQGKTIWQQACGDTDRNYSEICLEFDVILNGPGYAGSYPQCAELLKKDEWSSKKISDIARFAVKMKDGDIVVLRLGTSDILGVGLVVGNYEWNELFGDIDGWDLQHMRRVKWLIKFNDQPKRFNTYDLKQGDTTQELTSPKIKEWLLSLSFAPKEMRRELKPLPVLEAKEVSHEEIADYLYEEGVASSSIEALFKEFDELRRIAKWYKDKDAPSESETVSYLAVPILRALGWTPQKMAIEWRNVDIALFDQLPRVDENLTIVVEAKKKGNSCLTAKSQAQEYAKKKFNCRRLIVTDGLRYGVYLKSGDDYKLYAYFNLIRLRDDYPVYGCKGVKEALRIMSTDWRKE